MNNEIKLDSKATNYLKDKLGGGGQGGEGIEFVELEYADNHTSQLTLEQKTALQNGAWVKLITAGVFTGFAIPMGNNQYTTPCGVNRKGTFCFYVNVDFDNNTYYTNAVAFTTE